MLETIAQYWPLWVTLWLSLGAYAWYNNAWRLEEIQKAKAEGRLPDLRGDGVAKMSGWRGFLQCGLPSMTVAAIGATLSFIGVLISFFAMNF